MLKQVDVDMRIFSTHRPPSPSQNRCGCTGPDQSGSILIYMVVVMLIFGFLGAGMVSMFTSTNMMGAGVPNDARKAEYLAEAGMRYAISELRNNGYTKGTISTLNSTTYTLDDAGSFTVNVFGKWFEPAADYNAASGTLSLNVPQGQFPSSTITTADFDIPAGAHVVNLEGYRDALIYSGDPEDFTAAIQSVTYSSILVTLADDFQAKASTVARPADPICLAVKSAAAQNPAANGVLNLPSAAKSFFPEKYGTFHVTATMDVKKTYFYEEMTDQTTHMQLTGLSEAVTVAVGDYIILAPRNHMIAATGAAGSTVSGGENFFAANYRQNIASPQDVTPPAKDLPSDVDTATATAAGAMTTVGDVSVSTSTGKITLGTLGTEGENQAGALFFGGNVSLGGSAVCTGGKCLFSDGLRAFFVVDYNGTGDGFTLAVLNGADNVLGTRGSGSAMLGYAGSGLGGGLKPPKMALEFDTHVNSTRNDPDMGTSPVPSHRDALQYVFWGAGPATNLEDDNYHGLGGAGPKWSLGASADPGYLPASGAFAIKTKPVLDEAIPALYFSSGNGYVHEVNPETGVPRTGTGFPLLLDGTTDSSPALDSRGHIFIGCNANYINVLTDTGSWDWWDTLHGYGKSSPVIDSNDVVYFGDDDAHFYAYDNDVNSEKWKIHLRDEDGDIPDDLNNAFIRSTPALSPDGLTVYFATQDQVPGVRDNDYLIAVDTSTGVVAWKFSLEGDCFSSPTVSDVDGTRGTIYIGGDGSSDQGVLFAVNPDGTEKWRYTFGSEEARSRPAIGPDGTIYIGNDDNYLYAITDNGTAGAFKWRYDTEDPDGDPLGNNVRGGPLVHADGTIWFGSLNNWLYAVNSSGQHIAKYNLHGDVASPTQGRDGTVYAGSTDTKLYAYKSTCYPANVKERVFSYDDLLASQAVEDLGNVDNSNNWLNGGSSDNRGKWAVRVEITRETTADSRGKYAYTLRSWIRQCGITDYTTCSEIAASYFADTRIDYTAHTPHLQQAVELCDEPPGSGDQSKFNTFLYGFTQATGSATQQVVIENLNLGFRRPGDAVITSDPNW